MWSMLATPDQHRVLNGHTESRNGMHPNEEESDMNKRLWALVVVFAFVLLACGGGDTTDTTEGTGTTVAGADGDCVIGMSWNNYNEERWAKHDEPAMKAAIEAGGCTYISSDAGSSEEQQITDVENLISQGAKVVIILAQNTQAILPAVQSATDQGIPVVAYDRLIESGDTFYVSFDNVLVGKLMAEVIYGLVPTGNYIIVKGNGSDANSDFLRDGIESVIGDAVTAGDITICCEDYTDNWDPSTAQTHVEQWLTQENNAVDAVVSENDGMATGAAAALADQGLNIPLSGQDADVAALNRVALGTQSVSVWKDARALGTAAGAAAVDLAHGMAMSDLSDTVDFLYTNKTSGAETTLTSILLTPIPITQDNLNLVVEADWITVDELCAGVTAGSVEACP
jgi:D-xylose transport system substrate-binding protein